MSLVMQSVAFRLKTLGGLVLILYSANFFPVIDDVNCNKIDSSFIADHFIEGEWKGKAFSSLVKKFCKVLQIETSEKHG